MNECHPALVLGIHKTELLKLLKLMEIISLTLRRPGLQFKNIQISTILAQKCSVEKESSFAL